MKSTKKYILALDQGTTSSRAVLFDHEQNIIGTAQKEFRQIYPKEGWVEHDPEEIFFSQYTVMMDVIDKCDAEVSEIAAIGVANQRETTILWDRDTGRPVYNAIVWQCRRTSDIIEDLVKCGFDEYIRETTGLVPDAYFSGSKIKWILDNVEEVREKAELGGVLFGTVDSYLVWRLTNGAVHVTDYTNASRTMLFDIRKICWDEKMLNALDIPKSILPDVCPSYGMIYGYTDIYGQKIPIAGIAGDQQAALFGQCCFDEGDAKNTYGTGCFLLTNTGTNLYTGNHRLIATIAASRADEIRYALEGSVFSGGAVVQWLRDEMLLLNNSEESEYYARTVHDSGGVYFVPAFTGLGAPYWDMYARGTIIGITRGTKREHIIRAALESIAYQSLDLTVAIEKNTGIKVGELKVDGGASRNSFLMQFQADIMNRILRRPVVWETTALGAAYLAGLSVGFWKDSDELRSLWKCGANFYPSMGQAERVRLLKGWHKAVDHSCGWARDLD